MPQYLVRRAVLVGMRWNSSEALLLNSFGGVSSLSPDWCYAVLAGYLLSFGSDPGKGLSGSYVVFSTFLGRLLRRLVLDWFNGHWSRGTGFLSCILITLLISSSDFFTDLLSYQREPFLTFEIAKISSQSRDDSSPNHPDRGKKIRTPSRVCFTIFKLWYFSKTIHFSIYQTEFDFEIFKITFLVNTSSKRCSHTAAGPHVLGPRGHFIIKHSRLMIKKPVPTSYFFSLALLSN